MIRQPPVPARGPDVDLVNVQLPRYVAQFLLAAMSQERPPTRQIANVVGTAIVDAMQPPDGRYGR